MRAVHIPSGLAVVARGERSQHRNKAEALERLAELLRMAGEVAVLAARQEQQANHDRLERGPQYGSFAGRTFVLTRVRPEKCGAVFR